MVCAQVIRIDYVWLNMMLLVAAMLLIYDLIYLAKSTFICYCCYGFTAAMIFKPSMVLKKILN